MYDMQLLCHNPRAAIESIMENGDCMEGSGARQASDVKPKLKSYITKKKENGSVKG